jgi:hypothetical protein
LEKNDRGTIILKNSLISSFNNADLSGFSYNYSLIDIYSQLSNSDLNILNCSFDSIYLYDNSLINSSFADKFTMLNCSFINIHSSGVNVNGSCIYCKLSKYEYFNLSNCSFFECSVSSDYNFGGCIYIFLDLNFGFNDNFFLSGYLNFFGCSASYGKNIFISSYNLSNFLTLEIISFNYELFPIYLLYGEDRNVDVGLWPFKKYLNSNSYHMCEKSSFDKCPSDCVSYFFIFFFFFFFIFIKY